MCVPGAGKANTKTGPCSVAHPQQERFTAKLSSTSALSSHNNIVILAAFKYIFHW